MAIFAIAVIVILAQKLATVLLVSKSHTSIIIGQCLEKIRDIFIVLELLG